MSAAPARKRKEAIVSKPLSCQEEEILMSKQEFGDSSPFLFIRTMWFWYTQNFGLRGRQEHMTKKEEDFVFCEDQNGDDYLEFWEDHTKTRQSGLRSKERITNPKMFPIGGDRCPVCLVKLYLSKWLPDMGEQGRFNLSPKVNALPSDAIWYHVI